MLAGKFPDLLSGAGPFGRPLGLPLTPFSNGRPLGIAIADTLTVICNNYMLMNGNLPRLEGVLAKPLPSRHRWRNASNCKYQGFY